MRRIGLAIAFVVSVLAPVAGEAHLQTGKVWRIGVLTALYPSDAAPSQAFRQRLRMLGYVEGQNLVIEWRYTQSRDDRLPGLAAELVRLKVDLMVADVTIAVRAAMQATSEIPIVMAASADALGGDLVSSLGRPGGNVTGNSILLAETSVKRLQLLKEAVPGISRVSVLWDPGTPFHRAMLKEIDATAPSLRLEPFAQRGETPGPPGRAAHEVRVGHQPEDGEGPRAHDPSLGAGAGRRGDPMRRGRPAAVVHPVAHNLAVERTPSARRSPRC